MTNVLKKIVCCSFHLDKNCLLLIFSLFVAAFKLKKKVCCQPILKKKVSLRLHLVLPPAPLNENDQHPMASHYHIMGRFVMIYTAPDSDSEIMSLGLCCVRELSSYVECQF